MEPMNGKNIHGVIQSGSQEAFSNVIQSNLKQSTKTSKSEHEERLTKHFKE